MIRESVYVAALFIPTKRVTKPVRVFSRLSQATLGRLRA